LHVYYGYLNWQRACELRKDVNGLAQIRVLQEAMKQPGVIYRGRLGQKELAKEFLSAGLWAYPTNFEESFGITAIEAQRARLPVVASNYAGLRTTVGNSGILIGSGNKGESYTPAYQERFLAECISLLKDDQKWQHWSEQGFENTKNRSWKHVAEWWKDLFSKE